MLTMAAGRNAARSEAAPKQLLAVAVFLARMLVSWIE
jgi:hypothetical protein